jgi:hypothetical protein
MLSSAAIPLFVILAGMQLIQQSTISQQQQQQYHTRSSTCARIDAGSRRATVT